MATIGMGQKEGGAAVQGGLLCTFRRGLGPHLTQSRLDRGLLPYQVVS